MSQKRKATSQEAEGASKKQQTAKVVKVVHVAGPDVAKPVIATAPGTIVPTNLKFTSYAEQTSAGALNLLLHSSDHDTINYTAVDSSTTTSNEHHLKHYVAVFDPTTGRLDVTEARKMTIKSKVRQFEQDSESEVEEPAQPAYSSRAALTEAFGSKKSKKAAASMTENRLIAGGVKDEENPLAKAILSTLADEPETSIEDYSSAARSLKPLPPADLEASDIREVYPLSTLITPQPTANTLSEMPLARWKDTYSKRKEIKTRSRFLAARFLYTIKYHYDNPSEASFLQNLQLLKYIEILLEVYKYATSLGNNRQMPNSDKWPAKTVQQGAPDHIIKEIAKNFFPDKRTTTFNTTRLQTYILALTLRIPPGGSQSAGAGLLATEPSDIQMDLGLDKTKGSQLFRELGCKMESATEKELQRWGLSKMQKKGAPKAKFAKLKFPLDFPKVSQGRALKSGGRR